MKSMLEINLGEHKENSVATTIITVDEPVEHTEVSCGCLSTSFKDNTVTLNMSVGKVKNPDDNFFDRFVLLKINTKEYIVKARVIR